MQGIINSKAYRIYDEKQKTLSSGANIFRLILDISTLILIYLALTKGGIFIGLAYLMSAYILYSLWKYVFVKYGLSIENNKKLSQVSSLSEEIFNYLSEDSLKLFKYSNDVSKKYEIAQANLTTMVFSLDKLYFGRFFLVRSGMVFSEDLKKQFLNTGSQNMSQEMLLKRFVNFMQDAKDKAIKEESETIELRHIIYALYRNNAFFSHAFSEMGLAEEDLDRILQWTQRAMDESTVLPFWKRDYYDAGIGKDWSYGYTPVLNLFSTDISQFISTRQVEYQVKARLDTISEIEDILAKSGKNNVMLVGETGVGKKTIVNAFAQKLAKGQTYDQLKYKHVVQLDVTRLLSGAKFKGEIEMRFSQIFNELVSASNIVLYIPDLINLLNGENLGSVDATGILTKYLESGNIQVITSVSSQDYKSKVQANSQIDKYFNKVMVKEMNKEDVLPSIEHGIAYIEIQHKIIFTYQALKHLIDLADRLIHDEPFPQKAIDLLTELGMKMQKDGVGLVGVKEVDEFISKRTSVPVGEVAGNEKDKLMNLELELQRRIIGQKEAINAISDALRRSRAGLSDKKKPIGSFLFIGPTGVGKTETAKALSETYFGSENNMIRFDMSEFQQPESLNQLIGYVSGDQFVPGRLTQSVKNNPYSLVLFDELEKAHPNILNLFLQMLDEGWITDGSDQKIMFQNTIIIATSNAGSNMIRDYINQNYDYEKMSKGVIDYLLQNNIFKPEFLNRFDKIVFFRPLDITEVAQITKAMIFKINSNLSSKNIRLQISQEAIDKLSKEGYDPVFGARPLRRLLQDKIESLLAKKIISGEVQKGQTVEIRPEDV